MSGRVIIIFAVVVLILLALRWFARTPAPVVAGAIRRNALILGILALIVLAATGRLHWLFALLGGLAAGLVRLLPVLRYLPFLGRLWAHFQPGGHHASGASGQQRSTVQARFIRMWLDHGSGEMSGEVLEGTFKGRQLHELDMEALVQLFQECLAADQESAQLLQAYLDRMHGDDWREKVSANAGQTTSAANTSMTRDEAYQILGLTSGASEQEVIEAHRRLMQKLHPDRGGSDYLAAKINQAKDLLLEN